jgi:hypothetical protein
VLKNALFIKSADGSSSASGFWLPDQIVEQCAVMNHGLPEVFGAGFALRLAHDDRVARAVMLHNKRMVHRKVGGLLVEIAHGVTTSGHCFANEVIPFLQCKFRGVNKLRLDQPPGVRKSRPVGRGKWLDIESFYSLFKLCKLLFASRSASGFFNGAAVLRTKPRAKPSAVPGFGQNQENSSHNDDGGKDHNQLNVGHIGSAPLRQLHKPKLARLLSVSPCTF